MVTGSLPCWPGVPELAQFLPECRAARISLGVPGTAALQVRCPDPGTAAEVSDGEAAVFDHAADGAFACAAEGSGLSHSHEKWQWDGLRRVCHGATSLG